MTSHTGRLYALAVALVVFFLAWAVVAAHPWQQAAADPRLKVLAVRQAQLQREAKLVQQIVAQRRSAATRSRQLAASVQAPAVRVVNLPPLTITRTS
jgi:hypothetical protein